MKYLYLVKTLFGKALKQKHGTVYVELYEQDISIQYISDNLEFIIFY